jgi:hypothetical protein
VKRDWELNRAVFHYQYESGSQKWLGCFAFVRLVIAAPEKASEDTQLRRKGG